MTGYLVFVRFFMGYCQPFPIERVVRSGRESLIQELNQLRDEWWADPNNRAKFPESGTEAPRFETVAHKAGWRDSRWGTEWGGNCGLYGITDHWPVARYDTRELADIAASALLVRTNELADAESEKSHSLGLSEEQRVLEWSNAVFIVVSEARIALHRVVDAIEKIQRIDHEPDGPQTSEERFWRILFPRVRGTLQAIKSLPKVESTKAVIDENAAPAPVPEPQVSLTSTQGQPETRTDVAEGKDEDVAGKKRRIPKDEAEKLVSDYLLQHGKPDPMAVTVDAIVKATGVSRGNVGGTKVWKAFEAKRKELRDQAPGQPRTIPLSEEMLASIPATSTGDPAELAAQKELEKTIREHEADKKTEDSLPVHRRKPRS